MRTSSAELLIELDRSQPRGLRAQVEDELRDSIRSGRLTPGAQLPSTRALAADLGVTRGVIVDAYDQLLAEGYLTSRPGSGTVVNASGKSRAAVRRPRADDAQVLVDFRPGLPDPDLFPRSTWLRATRAALQTLPGDQLGYMDPLGLPQLRDAVAEYLGRVRGVSTDGDHVVICNGFGHGLSMAVRALQESGDDAFAVENPGHDGPRTEIEWLGARYRGVDVDGDGLVVDQLRRSRARTALLTPAHQFPTGAVLSAERRTALAAWARDVNGYIIEDDYDAEYRYDRHPRRTRRVSRQRRDALIAALARWLPEAIPSGIAAGLHLLVTLPRGPDDAEVTERARAAGVVVYPLRTYRTSHPPDRPPALVLGYGTLSPAQMDDGVRLLAEASHP